MSMILKGGLLQDLEPLLPEALARSVTQPGEEEQRALKQTPSTAILRKSHMPSQRSQSHLSPPQTLCAAPCQQELGNQRGHALLFGCPRSYLEASPVMLNGVAYSQESVDRVTTCSEKDSSEMSAFCFRVSLHLWVHCYQMLK